jgi:ABC-2 type transport system ATP-binding protein
VVDVGAPLVAQGLTKRFGAFPAVNALDLDVRAGEVFGFLGPNGAGKTTTIRLVLDFLRPTSGTVTVLGSTAADVGVRRRIGYLPADLHVDPRYTASELFDFLGHIRGGFDRARLGVLLERFQLDPSRPLRDLSTGNRRKVGIVQAFLHRPELYVLDEPSSGLDPLLQHEFLLLVRESVTEGATVFLSSHQLPEVERVADRVGILRRGELVAVLDVAELRRRARQHIDLTVEGQPDLAVFDGVPGVVQVSAHGGQVRVVVEGSVDAVLKAAARLPVERIATEEADLEHVFLDFYRSGGE